MKEWKEYKLGEIAEIISERTSINNASLENYISTENMINDFGGIRIAEKLPTSSSINTFQESDILFSNIRTYFKKVWYSSFSGTVSPDVIVFRAKDCDSRYLYYQLCNPEFTEYTVLTSKGAKMPRGDKDAIKNFDVLLPPLPEQTAIASVLSSLDDKIDLLHRQNETLEKMAEALFRQWFVEEAEEDWEEVPLSYFGEIICGKTPSKKFQEYFNGEYSFIKIPDMHGKTFVFDTTDSLSEKGFNSQINKSLPEKSINVSCIATVGLVTMNAKKAQTNQQINSIIPKEGFRYYLFCTMKASYNLLHSMASGGTATLNLNTGDFSKIKIPLPNKETITSFNEVVTPKFDKIFENQTQIRTLTSLRDTLLPKLMSGEVRVKI